MVGALLQWATEGRMMRMTDETPRVNHSFALVAYVIFRQTKPQIGSPIG
jgi:hypothetical protein